ncbi:MAG TPA: hypothetical protein VLC46_18105 [Thermoanaerobaculia bacterium]|jgi:hypothetical protein|nr:hypothetical protein [Thermoanaerobaculia bacterium]
MDPTPLYVRIEGVNLDNFVYDVHDLSTIRGGSFLLLDAVRRVQDRFGLTAISTGASSGLFTAPEGSAMSDADALRREIEQFLSDSDGKQRPKGEADQLKHATFVVDVRAEGEGDEGFERAREPLLAMNRWRQFQQPTVAVPARGSRQDECAFDHVRPAASDVWVRENEKDVKKAASASVAARRTFGRGQKKAFYEEELQRLARAIIENDPSAEEESEAVRQLARSVAAMDFTNDLETLADNGTPRSLDGKIAVVYFDGNKFGRIQKGCKRPDLEAFDRTVKRYRGQALQRLLQSIVDAPDGWLAGEEIRLETLLWGGDELIWVVPAWKGWSVLRLFYEVSRDWRFNPETKPVEPLTHAGGVVFCHRVAPIHRMTELAKKLADSCKEWFDREPKPPNDHASRDVFAYQVLESFDHIGTEFETFRETRVPLGCSVRELGVHCTGMDKATSAFDIVRRTFPSSKLHAIVALIRDHEVEEAKLMIEKTVSELRQEGKVAVNELLSFFDPSSEGLTGWYHIAELWDYAV